MATFNFTVEEINLIAIYRASTRAKTLDRIAHVLPDLDGDMLEIAKSAVRKLAVMSEPEFQMSSFIAADEAGG